MLIRLFILAEIGNFTASELKEYENSLKSMSDYYNIIDSAEKRAREEGLLQGRLQGREEGLAEGRAEGREEGRAEGREEGRADAAKRMVASGITKEQVAVILQLSIKEINTLLAF